MSDYDAFVAGFSASGEGFNGEYPFDNDIERIAANEQVRLAFDAHTGKRCDATFHVDRDSWFECSLIVGHNGKHACDIEPERGEGLARVEWP